MQLLELVVIGLLGRPANDETLVVRSRGLGDDVEVDVIDLLVCKPSVILQQGVSAVVWWDRRQDAPGGCCSAPRRRQGQSSSRQGASQRGTRLGLRASSQRGLGIVPASSVTDTRANSTDVLTLRNDQGVSLRQGADVQEGVDEVVLDELVARNLACIQPGSSSR